MEKCNKSSVLLVIFAVILCISAAGSVSAAGTGNNTTNTTNITNTTGLANTSCPEYQINGSHTGQSKYTGPQTNTTKWTYNGITVYGSAVTGSDGTIYVGSYNGKLYAFNPNGTVKWIYTTASSILGSPAIGKDGTIYVSDYKNSTLYSINPNGTLKWKYNIGNWNCGSSPVIGNNGTIYIPVTDSTNGTLYAIDSTNGKVKWTFNMNEVYGSSAAIGNDGTIYIADYNGILYAINPNGSLKWSYALKYYTSATVSYDTPSIGSDGTIYILSNGGSTGCALFAVSDTGTLKWTYPFHASGLEPLYGAPAISSNGTIYFIGASNLYAVNSTTGKYKWTYSTGGIATDEATSIAIGADGTIYFGSSTGLYAIIDNGSNGLLKWSYTTGSICASPTIGSDGTLYIGDMNGTFYALNDLADDFTVNNKGSGTVQFDGSSTGTPESWKWDFGDGTASTAQNPMHTYSKSGNYIVTLTVTLNNGKALTRIKTVTIDITAPTVTISPITGTFSTPETITINASDNSGSVTVYYTTDGSDPRTSSTRSVYTTPLVIKDTTTFKFAAVDPSGNWSPVYNETYTQSWPETNTTITINNSSDYTNGSLSSQIQQILDNAPPGSTIIFLGKEYDNLHLIINKKLNIITSAKTKLVASDSLPVFLVNGSQASGTTISGFTIINTGTGPGILINNTSNTSIIGDAVSSTGGSAVIISGSSNTAVNDSSLTNSVMGIDISGSKNTQINGSTITNNTERGIGIYNSTSTTVNKSTMTNNGNKKTAGLHSDEGAIYINGSNGVKVTNSQINDNSQGVTIRDASNVNVSNDTINGNYGEGILLSGSLTNITMENNVIDRNANGIELDYTKCKNITIKSNLISGSLSNDLNDPENTGSGISVGFDLEYGLSKDEKENDDATVSIKHNVFFNNYYRVLDAMNDPSHSTDSDDYYPFSVGSNVYGYEWSGNNPGPGPGGAGLPFCCKWRTKAAQLHLELVNGEYKAYFTDGDTGDIITDIPSIPITFTINGVTYTATTQIGVATIKASPNTSGDASASFDHMSTSTTGTNLNYMYIPGSGITYGTYTPGSGNSGGGSGNGKGPSTNGAGGGSGGSGSSASSGATSGSSSSTGVSEAAAAAESAAGQAGSNGQQSSQTKNSKTAKELFIDNTAKNQQFWGIIGIIVLLILVFGAYYRKDLMNMIRKSKK